MSTIDFTCPHCQSQMNFPSASVGQQGKCSGCQQIVTIQPDPTPALPNPAAKNRIFAWAAVGCGALLVLGLAFCLVLFLFVFPVEQRTEQLVESITNTIGGKPDIDDFGRSVLAAVKTRDIQELAKTYASYDELLEIKERWDSVSAIKMPIDVSREEFEQIPNLEKVIRYFSIRASKLPEDAKYVACKPGLLIKPSEETKATAEQIGLESTNNARVIASDDKNLYIISLDSLTGTPLGWFTTGDFFDIDVVPIDDELKSSGLRIQKEYEANGWPERWHPLTITAEKRVLEFVKSL